MKNFDSINYDDDNLLSVLEFELLLNGFVGVVRRGGLSSIFLVILKDKVIGVILINEE